MSFFLRQRKKYTGKKPRKNSVSENPSKVRSFTQNVDSPNVTPKLVKLTWYPVVKTQTSGQDFKISKNRFNRYGGYGRQKYIDRLECETILYGTVWMRDLTCPTFWKFEISGLATWIHISGYIDACKCTEIFRKKSSFKSLERLRIKIIKFLYKS